ncbi:hypothetical protein COOONC_04510 [Cooperia oncophora]
MVRWLHEDNEHIVGYLALSLQYSSIYTSVAMTVNRFIVVTFPRHYNKWFNTKTTMVSITACWVIAWVHNTIHLKEGCNFTFDAQIRQFKFSDGRMRTHTFTLSRSDLQPHNRQSLLRLSTSTVYLN